jgi:hypothetical protein
VLHTTYTGRHQNGRNVRADGDGPDLVEPALVLEDRDVAGQAVVQPKAAGWR